MHCGSFFESNRKHARWCSEACRKAASRQHAYPVELTDAARWIRWKYIVRERKQTKIPLQLNGNTASSTNPTTWTTYKEASASTQGIGLGFVLSLDDDIYCIDLDNCLKDGKPSARAQAILDHAGYTYVEVSPSGNGLHIFLRGKCEHAMVNRILGIEVYHQGRFLCMTGKALTKCRTIARMDYEVIRESWTPRLVPHR